jgi:hypothetical protein
MSWKVVSTACCTEDIQIRTCHAVGHLIWRSSSMCRKIKPLFNLEPPATEEEIYAASLQNVRKVTGFNKPSKTNEAAFTFATYRAG